MRSNYSPDIGCCCDYYKGQAGGNIPFYAGSTVQHGGGVGDILKGLFRSAVPMMKAVGKKVLPKLARVGLKTVNDIVVKKQTPKQALFANVTKELQGKPGKTIKGVRRGIKRKRRRGHTGKGVKRQLLKENY